MNPVNLRQGYILLFSPYAAYLPWYLVTLLAPIPAFVHTFYDIYIYIHILLHFSRLRGRQVAYGWADPICIGLWPLFCWWMPTFLWAGSYRGCKLANEMTRDLCTSGDKADFTVCTKVCKWESVCVFYRFPEDSMKWTLWGNQFISIESTWIDNKLGFSLNSFNFIVC
jgi:hypothetical protein